jgi:hypothetical protein
MNCFKVSGSQSFIIRSNIESKISEANYNRMTREASVTIE